MSDKHCINCGGVEHEGQCDSVLKAAWDKALTLQELIDLPIDTVFLYKGTRAQIKWKDHERFLISKGEPDAYFRNDSVCFEYVDKSEKVTLTSCFPAPKILKMLHECERW